MKIAMMTNNYKPFIAGVPISIERLAESLRAQGHQVVVFAPSYDAQEEETNVVRYRSLLRGIAGGASIPYSLDSTIEKEFRDGHFDVIHVHHPMLIGHTASFLSRKYNVPIVFTYHTRYEQYLHYFGLSGFKKLIPAYIRNCMKHSDMILAPTPMIKDYLEGIQQEVSVRVLPTGIPEDGFHPEQIKVEQVNRNLRGSAKYLFCTISRLAKEKNLEFLLDCMRCYKDRTQEDFRLVLIGDGPEKENLMQYARDLGLEKEIVFAGTVPNNQIKNYCSASDLFLFTSCSETQGIVLLEAMAAGTPVLALKATGVKDVVLNGKNGYMIPTIGENTEIAEAYAERLMDILEKKELYYLEQGALETAGNYHGKRIAAQAVLAYKEAIWNHDIKEQQKLDGRNRHQDMVYF